MILTCTDLDAIHSLKDYLHQEFSIKDLGQLSFFLGIEVGHLSIEIFSSQKKCTYELIDGCSLDLTKNASTPLPLNTKLNAAGGALFSDPE